MTRPPARTWSKLLPHQALPALAGEPWSPSCTPQACTDIQEVTEGVREPQHRPLPACLSDTP